MTENIADRYRRLSSGFSALIATVPPDRWASPSPCEDWTVRDVVVHVIDSQGIFLRLVHSDLVPGPEVADDPAGAWLAASAQTQRGLDDVDFAGRQFDGFFGRTTYAQAVERFLNNDLVVHQWDLAWGSGQNLQMARHDITTLTSAVAEFGAAARSPGVYGPALDVADTADDQTRVLALVGRDAGLASLKNSGSQGLTHD